MILHLFACLFVKVCVLFNNVFVCIVLAAGKKEDVCRRIGDFPPIEQKHAYEPQLSDDIAEIIEQLRAQPQHLLVKTAQTLNIRSCTCKICLRWLILVLFCITNVFVALTCVFYD